MHRLILHNDLILDASQPCLAAGQVGFLTGWGVFSTIRVSRGVLFAFDRHYARMRKDAELMRVPFPESQDWLEQRLLKLVQANDAPNATLRVNIVRNNGGLFHHPTERPFDLVAFTADLSQWGESARLGVVQQGRHARSRFAGTKVTSWAFNLTTYEQAQSDGYSEVVLLDESGYVSECTSANIFAVFGSEVATPPLSSGCLAGITRDLLLTEVHCPPYRIVERALTLHDLEAADEVFITSSTRDLLPVSFVEGISIKLQGEACATLSAAFRSYRTQYVDSRVPADVNAE